MEMIDREKVTRAVDSCFDYWLEQHRCLLPLELEAVRQLKTDALTLLKEQESIKQKMWNALYAEEDKLEKQYAGTNMNDDWFLVYRPWLQRGFEIALEVIVKQEGQLG